eukprot:snap_masked-scaffold233_size243130-processed-gene-1.17 protein:Tk00492 transcript:snap_masked-scaffold233_size243130-processed-gene-1.17-mRNA-1 annotation:"PREDICTED: uncharacterized protein LOC100902024"
MTTKDDLGVSQLVMRSNDEHGYMSRAIAELTLNAEEMLELDFAHPSSVLALSEDIAAARIHYTSARGLLSEASSQEVGFEADVGGLTGEENYMYMFRFLSSIHDIELKEKLFALKDPTLADIAEAISIHTAAFDCARMPKETNPSALIAEFGGSKVWTYNATTKALFCQLCMITIDIKKKSSTKKHISTEKHKRGIERETKGEARQQQLLTSVVKRSSFTTDLAKVMVSANIPLSKVENPDFRKFLEVYCKQPVQGRNTLTKVIEEETKEQLQNIKAKFSGKDLCIQVDETTDRQGRSMTAILASPLDGQSRDRPFMIDCVDIITANNVTLQQAVIKSLSKLFGDEVDFNKLRMEGAPYCIKAGLGLKSLCPNMLHSTCLAHGVNRVAELARVTYPKANRLLSEVKKNFVKSSHRKREFATFCKVLLPPEPVITR